MRTRHQRARIYTGCVCVSAHRPPTPKPYIRYVCGLVASVGKCSVRHVLYATSVFSCWRNHWLCHCIVCWRNHWLCHCVVSNGQWFGMSQWKRMPPYTREFSAPMPLYRFASKLQVRGGENTRISWQKERHLDTLTDPNPSYSTCNV